MLFRPLLRHCADEQREDRARTPDPALYASAYIGHGPDGAYFDQPGRYAIRASYVAADGSRIVSPSPSCACGRRMTAADEEAGELLMGAEQGQILALLGSESSTLQAGNEALDALLERPATIRWRRTRGWRRASSPRVTSSA